MSFNANTNDFIAVANLTLKLYRSFKGATGEFNEISSQLASFHVVVCDLKDQAEDPASLLNRYGKSELVERVNGLHTTLRQLENLFDQSQQIGHLGQEQLSALHEKLTIQIGLINQYTTNLNTEHVRATSGAYPNGFMAPPVMKYPEPVHQNASPHISTEDILTKPGKPVDEMYIVELQSETSTLRPSRSDPSFRDDFAHGDGLPNRNGSASSRHAKKSCCSLFFRDFICDFCCGCPEFTAKDTPKILVPY